LAIWIIITSSHHSRVWSSGGREPFLWKQTQQRNKYSSSEKRRKSLQVQTQTNYKIFPNRLIPIVPLCLCLNGKVHKSRWFDMKTQNRRYESFLLFPMWNQMHLWVILGSHHTDDNDPDNQNLALNWNTNVRNNGSASI